MSRETHVQFCESLRVRFPGATHRNIYVRSQRAGQRVMTNVATAQAQGERGQECGGSTSGAKVLGV